MDRERTSKKLGREGRGCGTTTTTEYGATRTITAGTGARAGAGAGAGAAELVLDAVQLLAGVGRHGVSAHEPAVVAVAARLQPVREGGPHPCCPLSWGPPCALRCAACGPEARKPGRGEVSPHSPLEDTSSKFHAPLYLVLHLFTHARQLVLLRAALGAAARACRPWFVLWLSPAVVLSRPPPHAQSTPIFETTSLASPENARARHV